MKTLNLNYPNKTDIPFQIHNFPDGEVMIEIDEIDHKEEVDVICRVANPNDLFILMQVGDVLSRRGLVFGLTITYLMSARMDRVMSFNKPFSLKLVVDAIKSIKPIKGIRLVEPHSERTSVELGQYFMREYNIFDKVDIHPDTTICFPDKGASDRYSGDFKFFLNNHICFEKSRDTLGNLVNFKLMSENFKGGRIAVVDDLCDGGGTFRGIANDLDALKPTGKDLYITHAIQKKGLEMLSEKYDEIYITDSYKDWSAEELPKNIHVINLF